MNQLQPLRTRNHAILTPLIAATDVHEFDQPEYVTAAAKVLHHVHDRMVIDTSLNHSIDFQMTKTSFLGRFDSLEHLRYAASAAAHPGKYFFIQAIQADGDSSQSGVSKLLRHFRQQNTVADQRKIFNTGNTSKAFDQVREARSQ